MGAQVQRRPCTEGPPLHAPRTSLLAWTSSPSVDRTGALRNLSVLEAAIAALEHGVTVHDEEGGVVVANPAALELLGLRDVAEGLPYADRVAEVLGDGRRLRDVLVEHVRPDDGCRRWLRATLEPLRAGNVVTGAVCSFVDITDDRALGTFRMLGRQLRALFDDARLAVCVKDLEGRLLLCSPGLASELGRPGEDLRGAREEDVLPAALLEVVQHADSEALARREPVVREEHAGDRTYSLVRVPLLDDQGEPFALAGVRIDVTVVRAEEHDVARVADELRLQLDAVDEGILLVDRDLHVSSINATARRLLQRGGGALALSPVEVVDAGEGDDDGLDLTGPLPRLVRSATHTGLARRDALARMETPEGEVRWLSVDVLPRSAPDDGRAVVTLRDVTDDQQRQEELLDAAYRDPLTGLGNRRLFDETLALALERARRYGQPLAVCMLDVDGLKRINDLHGHAGGDRALRALGQVLRDELRGEDLTVRATPGVLPSRYGGDEFFLLFADVGGEGAPDVAARTALERVLFALRRADVDVPVTISSGIAVFPADGEDAATLLAAADRRMYEHKRRRGPGADERAG